MHVPPAHTQGCKVYACILTPFLISAHKHYQKRLLLCFIAPQFIQSFSVYNLHTHHFNRECLGEAHEPCDCQTWRNWLQKVTEMKPEECKPDLLSYIISSDASVLCYHNKPVESTHREPESL